MEINEALSARFGLDYLKTCVKQEFAKRAERNTALVATEKGLQPAKDADLSKEVIKKHNEQAFLDGCRKYNLALRKKIELILLELQEKKIARLKEELGIDHVPPSTFNSANYLKKHFDALQAIARDNRTEEEYFNSVRNYFKEGIEDIVLYDLFTSIQKYAKYNTVGTIYLFFHELNRRRDNNTIEGYPQKSRFTSPLALTEFHLFNFAHQLFICKKREHRPTAHSPGLPHPDHIHSAERRPLWGASSTRAFCCPLPLWQES
ncbi:MAG: hypothetical protein KAV83_07455 [Desulfobacterales bacterium]|nr:hypothetical protein [Desulfobacterales bacterium]